MLNLALCLLTRGWRVVGAQIWLLYLSSNLFGQNGQPRFETISLEQGLSQVSAQCVLQDRRGFLWVGTQDGLNRYDGYDFQVFKHDGEDPDSLSGHYIRTLLEDQRGVLWIGTDTGGLNRFHARNETFTAYRHDPDVAGSISDNRVFTSFEDRQGVIWLGTWSGGLNRMVQDSDGNLSFEHFRADPNTPHSISHDAVTAIAEDGRGHLWLGTFGGGLNRFDGNGFKAWRQGTDENSLSDDRILSLAIDGDGIIWIGTYAGGLNRFDPDTQSFTVFRHDPNDLEGLGNDRVGALFEDNDGTLWIGTGHGLNKLGASGWSRYRNDPGNPFSLGHDRIEAIQGDRNGLLWVGTMGGGLSKLDPKATRFGHVPYGAAQPDGLNDGSVLSFYEGENGTLWVGTYKGGLNQRDPDATGFDHFRHDPDDSASLSHNTIFSLLEDNQGDLWIGTDGGGLNRKKPGSQGFAHFRHDKTDPDSLSNDRVSSLAVGSQGLLWAGTFGGGLNRMDLNNPGRFTHFKNDPNRPESLSHNTILSLLADRAGHLWIGTWGGGLNRFDPASESFLSFQHDPETRDSLSHNAINAIFQDKRGVLWVGTHGGGLNRMEATGSQTRFTRYGEKDGLPNNVIYGMLGDDRGFLWISTNNGLARFDPEREAFRNYTRRDGLQSDEFNFSAYHRGKSGRLYFGGNKGFNQFFPDQLEEHSRAPALVLTELLLLNEPVAVARGAAKDEGFQLQNPIGQTKRIALSHRDTMLGFEFSALHFADPRRNLYRYKLDGFDKDWITTHAARRLATYTNLDPGTYTFQVMGANKDGVWSDQPATIELFIAPPLWRTGWAYAGYAFLLALALGAVYRSHRAKLFRERERNRQLDQTVAARTRELRQNNKALTEQQQELLRTQEQLITQTDALARQTTRLKEIDQAKTRFFTNVSHELRTPLTLITAPLTDLLAKDDTRNLAELNMVYRNAARLRRLIDQLLDVAGLEAGKLKLNREATNIITFTSSCVELFSSWAQRRRIALSFEADSEETILALDPDKLETVLTNILINAFKFTPDGGRIRVEIRESDQHVHLTVTDSGPGLSPDQAARVFDRYYQTPTSIGKGGSGIGLFLARELLTLHGGSIEVESQPGKGCAFQICLPKNSPQDLMAKPLNDTRTLQSDTIEALLPAATRGEPEPSLKAGDDAEKPTILVIEDHQDMLTYLCRQLYEYQVLEAPDGNSGLTIAREQLPDLVLSDVMMPHLSGYELVDHLKHDPRTSHIPVLLLTAKCSPAAKLEGLEAGADDFLVKPFDRDELLARIANLIAQRQRLRERYRGELLAHPNPAETLSADESFLKKVADVVEGHLGDSELSAHALAGEVGFSARQLARKLKALTGRTPAEFIRHFRLQHSARLLEQRAGGVAEIAYQAGFKSPRHFATLFRETFGSSPSEYAAQSPKNSH